MSEYTDLIERLCEESRSKQSIAWNRMDGGQECSFTANLADESAAAIVKLEAERAWQPIETAPKDGTAVLGVLTGSELPHIIRYLRGAWLIAWDGYDLSASCDAPTHWRALPPTRTPAGN